MPADGTEGRGTVGGVRRFAALLLLVAALGGCDRGGTNSRGAVSSADNGLSLTVSFDEPLRTGHPVTWTLELQNRGKDPLRLKFSSGKEGDVALLQGSREAYRWSANRLFSQALRELTLAAGETHSFKLEDRSLSAPAGDYDLVAQMASEPSPGAVRRPVTVR